ncbi:MAG: helix-turn-helix transcriptional regulator [Steroidobacterales bacterium]
MTRCWSALPHPAMVISLGEFTETAYRETRQIHKKSDSRFVWFMWQAVRVLLSGKGRPPASEAIMELLRTKLVTTMTGLSRMTIYRLELAGQFPARRKLAKNSVAWLEDEIKASINSRPSGPVSRRGVEPPLPLFS